MSASLCYNSTYILTNVPAMVAHPGTWPNLNRRFDMGILSRKTTGIYKITNLINGKCYIGQSCQIPVRWSQHKHEMNGAGGNNPYLYRALRKYGIDNFSFEVVKECDVDQLDTLERKYIASYNSLYPNGYNLESGGWGRKNLSPLTKLRISLSKRGTVSSKRTPVNQYTSSGRYICTFPSMSEAAASVGKLSPGHIANCCTGKRGLAHGFQWKYANAGNGNIEPFIDVRETPVSQFTKDGIYIATFESVRKASEALGISATNISNCCKTHNQNTAGGYQWRRGKSIKNIGCVSYKVLGEKHKIKVKQFTVDERYVKTHSSVTDAAKSIGVSVSSISACLNGHHKTAGGFIWRFA